MNIGGYSGERKGSLGGIGGRGIGIGVIRFGIRLGRSRMKVRVMGGLACLRGRRARRLGMLPALFPPPPVVEGV